MTGGGNPSRRFFDGSREPADEVSGEGRASLLTGREFGAVGRDTASADRMENEFWVAIPVEATGVADDALLCFLGIFEHQNKGVVEGCQLYMCVCVCVCVYCLARVCRAMWRMAAPPMGHTAG